MGELYLPDSQSWGSELGEQTVEDGGVEVHQETPLPTHRHTHNTHRALLARVGC